MSGSLLPDLPEVEKLSQLRRGLAVLELLSHGPASGAVIARELGINRSTAMRLLSELEDAGYAHRRGGTKYELESSKLLRLSARPGAIDGTDAVQELLVRLRDDYGEATVLGAPSHDSIVYVSFLPSRYAVAVREQMGTARPMHASALGKAYLSALDREAMEVELARLRYQGGTSTAAANADELRRRVEQVRERGYAVDRDETFEGVSCVAAPARIGEALIGAIGISGPSQRITPGFIEDVAGRLTLEVKELERLHG